MTERGTGRVMGLHRDRVKRMLVEVAEGWMGMELPRAAIRDHFKDMFNVTEEQADGLTQALTRTAGVRRVDHGHYLFTEAAVRYLKHREWRLPSGRLDLPAAEALVEMVDRAEQEGADVPEPLEALRDRARHAIRALGRSRSKGTLEKERA